MLICLTQYTSSPWCKYGFVPGKVIRNPQVMSVECWYGDGPKEWVGAARGIVDSAQRVAAHHGASVLRAGEWVAGEACVRPICGGRVRTVLRVQDGPTFAGTWDLLSSAVNRVFRGDRFRAWDCVAGGGFAGAPAVSGAWVGADARRSLDDFTHAAIDCAGDPSGSVWLGAGTTGRSRAFEGFNDWGGWDHAGGQRGIALHCAARHRPRLSGVLGAVGE